MAMLKEKSLDPYSIGMTLELNSINNHENY